MHPQGDPIVSELIEHHLSPYLQWIYYKLAGSRRRSVAKVIFNILFRLEGGHYRSATVRKLIENDYKVSIGAHSYGDCFVPGAFAPSVKVGKFVSIAKDVKVFTQNHPIDRISTHPYFYEKNFGIISEDQLAPATTSIGNDVWIGQNAILLPGCQQVGNGAIIGAGSVVTKNVPDYAIVAGNPAKVIRYRYNADQIQKIQQSKWWDEDYTLICRHQQEFCKTVSELNHAQILSKS